MSKSNRAVATIIRVRGKEAGTWATALSLPNNQRLLLQPIACNAVSKAVRNFDAQANIPFQSGTVKLQEKGMFSMGRAIDALNTAAGTIYVDELKLTKTMQKAIAPAEEAAPVAAKPAKPAKPAKAKKVKAPVVEETTA